ncbi:uncharacterized protein N7483_005070 [Penicillium malachiteum]|uniref:uncharacterized protein n=1 Tax=Penicillium malachiteum TaxID=1324776 RepID=UPI0025481E61|nr:uncharacterized protein N7483_005070 [Penicillium malachiteum]KAJ5730562.1 hypothetical protein N7483_005070 [Penicillium malachiteum]
MAASPTSSASSAEYETNDSPTEELSPDPVLLDEEENALEGGEADNIVASPTQSKIPGLGYNAIKTHNGQLYSGMAIGGSHTWNYDPGVWKETKNEPDLWSIDYQTRKRRARNAPKGSGAPIGTEYHWLIVGHQPKANTIQHVRKVDPNTYETHLTGSKYKLAHKSVSSGSWSIPTVQGQRERELELLEDAQRRIRGLPPVLASEKVRVAHLEQGQQRLDKMFGKVKGPPSPPQESSGPRKKRRM